MAKRARFSNLFDTYDHGPRQERRRIAARLCMGQSLAEMARLDGEPQPPARVPTLNEHGAALRAEFVK